MGKTSYTNGKTFEIDLCNYFKDNGYYVIYNEKGISGSQPVDMIVIKNNIATMIECKNLENKNGKFPISRIEANQLLSYKFAKSCGNHNFIIAVHWNNNIYFIDFDLLQFFDKSIDLKNIKPSIEGFNNEN